MNHNYYIYVVSNPGRSVLYTGVTNDLISRTQQHFEERGKKRTFAGRYYCYELIYYEHFSDINDAIAREKEIKGWSRKKKEAMILTMNPYLHTLKV